MNKKVLSLFLVFLLVVSSIVPVYAAQSDYDKHWAESTIEHWLEKGLVSGSGEGQFKPDNRIIRAEFVKMVNNAFGFTEKADISFKDVNKKDWYYSDVQKAVAAGYIKGTSATEFSPKKELTREEAASMLARIKNLSDNADANKKFADEALISDWAKGTVGAAVEAGYIVGSNGKFNPTYSTTRAEAITMLDRVVNIVVAKSGTVITGETFQSVTIDKSVGNGEVTLSKVVILDELIVNGGGENSIILDNSKVNGLTVNKEDGKVRILAKGSTTVATTLLESGAILEQSELTSNCFDKVEISSKISKNQTVVIKANIADLAVNGQAKVQALSGNIGTMTVSSDAAGSTINLAKGVVVGDVIINAKVSFTGEGTIKTATVNVSGVSFEKQPEKVEVAPGVTPPTIGGGGSGGGGSTAPSNPTVTSVTVTPSAISVEKGKTQQFTATVIGTDNPSQDVVWTVTTATGISISNTGLLTVAENTTVSTITVTATSKLDNTKFGTATVTITEPVEPTVPTITGVTIAPDSVTTTSAAIQFSATVTGTGINTPSITWDVTSSAITGSAISLTMNNDGVLTFSGVTTSTAITGAAITVTATATEGSSSKSESVTYDVTILNGTIELRKKN